MLASKRSICAIGARDDRHRGVAGVQIWLGLHFRRAMTDGNRLGQDVTSYVLPNAFRPAWGRHWQDR